MSLTQSFDLEWKADTTDPDIKSGVLWGSCMLIHDSNVMLMWGGLKAGNTSGHRQPLDRETGTFPSLTTSKR